MWQNLAEDIADEFESHERPVERLHRQESWGHWRRTRHIESIARWKFRHPDKCRTYRITGYARLRNDPERWREHLASVRAGRRRREVEAREASRKRIQHERIDTAALCGVIECRECGSRRVKTARDYPIRLVCLDCGNGKRRTA